MENLDFMTVSEVAKALRLSRVTINRMIHKNELKAHRFGKVYRIPKEEVNRYINGSNIPNHNLKTEDNKEEFSTARSLMKHFGTWVGDDADDVLEYILKNRTRARF